MQLTFGNMTLELNIFHLSNNPKPEKGEGQEFDEVCSMVQVQETQKLTCCRRNWCRKMKQWVEN